MNLPLHARLSIESWQESHQFSPTALDALRKISTLKLISLMALCLSLGGSKLVSAQAFDVSEALYAGDGERFSFSDQEAMPGSLAFNDDGTKMYVMGLSGADINEYTLGTAYDVSTAAYSGDSERFDVSGEETEPLSLAFNNDGTKMFVMGTSGNDINEYALGTGFDVSTAAYAGASEDFSVNSQESSPFSMAFNDDGTKMYVIGWSGDDVNEYALNEPPFRDQYCGVG